MANFPQNISTNGHIITNNCKILQTTVLFSRVLLRNVNRLFFFFGRGVVKQSSFTGVFPPRLIWNIETRYNNISTLGSVQVLHKHI